MVNDNFRQEFTKTLIKLGERVGAMTREELEKLSLQAANENPWFSRENVQFAFEGLIHMLKPASAETWMANYDPPQKIINVGLILAGNIPMVGFHDILSVLASRNRALIKLSTKDRILIQFLLDLIQVINPDIASMIEIRDQLKDMDAVIATGSDNSARYFERYFGKYPHIIRKNRTSVAILTSKETPEELSRLGTDIFTYFGLGCRNVSKLYVPENYDFNLFFESIEPFSHVSNHYKYSNNYDFNKSVYLVNNESHLDNGFLLLKPSPDLVSPVSVLFFEVYKDNDHLQMLLDSNTDKIQCIVEAQPQTSHITFGNAQKPQLWDYADNVNTLEFLENVDD